MKKHPVLIISLLGACLFFAVGGHVGGNVRNGDLTVRIGFR